MSEMSDYFTRDGANEGERMKLKKPTGEDSGDWIHVLGRDSDAFRVAKLESEREAAKVFTDKSLNKEAIAEELHLIDVRAVSKLIHSWSFNVDCDPDKKVELLREAPQIFDAINIFGGDRELFFTRKKKSLLERSKNPPKSPKTKKAATKA